MSDSTCISSKCKALQNHLTERFSEVGASVSDEQGPALLVSVYGRADCLAIDLFTISQDGNGDLSKGSKIQVDKLMALYLTP